MIYIIFYFQLCEVAMLVGIFDIDSDYEECKQEVAHFANFTFERLVQNWIFPENLCSMFLMWNADGCVQQF